jgi:hypothetical protein
VETLYRLARASASSRADKLRLTNALRKSTRETRTWHTRCNLADTVFRSETVTQAFLLDIHKEPFMTRKKLTALAVFAAMGCAANAAQANLILAGPENFSGTGLGAVNTILTIQNTNSTGTQVTSGNVQALTGTKSLSTLGVTSASNLRVVFNASEPNTAADQSITLTDLTLNIFSPTGTLLFTSGTVFADQAFANTQTGTGNSGFVFRLDTTQAAQAQAAAFGTGFGSNLVGLSATATNAAGGLETFFVANTGTPITSAPIPEPGTMALFAAGLLGMGGIARRRMKS